MKRRSQAPALPLDFDRAEPSPDEPPDAEPAIDPRALVRELGVRLTVGKAPPPRPRPPSCTRPAPIAAKPDRYRHLATPVETLERMAAAGDRAASIELAAKRAAMNKAAALDQAAAAAGPDPGENEP